MITKAPEGQTGSSPLTSPRQGQTTSTSPATRIERIVMNTTPKNKQQQSPKMVVVTEVDEVWVHFFRCNQSLNLLILFMIIS